MRKLLMYVIIGIILIGCTHFEISNEIHPKVTIIDRDVGLVYKLGNILISDTIERVNKEKIKYLKENDGVKFTLHVTLEEDVNYNPQFYYYINGIILSDDGTSPVSSELLLANMDNIDGFNLYKINGKEVSEYDEEIIQEEINKSIEDITEIDKYQQDNSKW